MTAQKGFFIIPVLTCLIVATVTVAWLIIPNSPQFYGKSIRKVKTKEKVVALTFDDGPNPPFTEQILKVLKKHAVKATFFVIGLRANKYPESVKHMYEAGHEIGNHSWSHNVLIFKSTKYIRQEITKTDQIIQNLGYTGTIHFRSPKGMKLINLPKVLSKQRRINILFDVVGWDWSCPGVKKIVYNVLSGVKPGSIILLHDGDGDNCNIIGDRSQTVEATDIIIRHLKSQNYKFLTISELIALKPMTQQNLLQ